MTALVVEPAFCGRTGLAQGGYVAGLVAAALGWNASVALRAPPPLGRPLDRRPAGDGYALYDGGTLIAEGSRATPEAAPPAAPPDFAAAEAASLSYIGFSRHTANVCFVCGPRHDRGRSLAVFPGWTEDEAMVAAPWVPPAWTADEEGRVRGEFLWAVLDCPGWAALSRVHIRPMVTARMTAGLLRRPKAGEPCVVVAWPIAEKGRKLTAGSAVFGEPGDLCAAARSLWLVVDDRARED